MDFLEFPDVVQEVRGAMNQGRLKLTNTAVVFKNNKTGKVDQIQSSDIELVNWQRLAGAFGLRFFLNNGQLHRFGGFKETDYEKLSKFFSNALKMSLKEKQLSLKGWNWGTVRFTGSVMKFEVDSVTNFEIPLLNVSQCTTTKNEVTLEFHQNDDAAVSLMEMRFHITADATEDTIEAFQENVMSKASIIQATGDAIATFKEVQCLTPRGRYDIKVFPTFIQLHGKTFDYKIPMTTVLRLFLLPHKDQRQMFFVVSLDPPIKQGQTRYPFLILQFNNEEETTLEVGLSDKELQEKYEGKLQQEMTGPTYEVVSKVMKALVQRKITVPGNFVGNSGTPAVSCSYKAAAGFMYPLERGFIYVHKPPLHIRFEEVASVNFARSGGSTRSFDFEVETRSGVVHTFSSIEKEEYGKLYDFITNKKLRVKNRGPMKAEQPNYTEEDLVDSDVEDEPDAYLARVKAEAQERDDFGGDGSSDDESDESFNPGESGSEVAEEYDSNVSTSSSSSEESDDGSGKNKSEKRPKKEKVNKPKKVKSSSEPRKTRKKQEKDANRPKRPQSAYFLWLNENRDRLKKKHPGISITDLSKRAGEEWKELKDKTKWEKLAEEAKKEYEKAMAEYRAQGGGAKPPSTPVKKEHAKKSPGASAQKSPQKSPGAYKSKEYISSSEGSSSDTDAKGKGTKGKADKKAVKKDVKEEPKDSNAEDEIEEESAGTTPVTSEDEDSDDKAKGAKRKPGKTTVKKEVKENPKESNSEAEMEEESAGTTPASSENDDDDV